jgi:uncharacterized membrane protein YcjF (UPF0283 family)
VALIIAAGIAAAAAAVWVVAAFPSPSVAVQGAFFSVPVVAAIVSLLAAEERARRWACFTASAVMAVLVVLGLASIGVFFLPATVLMFFAGLIPHSEPGAVARTRQGSPSRHVQ